MNIFLLTRLQVIRVSESENAKNDRLPRENVNLVFFIIINI